MHTRTHGVELCDGFVSGSGTAPVRPVLALGLQEQRRLKPPRVAVVGFERLAQIPAQRHRLGRPVNLKRCSVRTGEHAHALVCFPYCFLLAGVRVWREIVREPSSQLHTNTPGHPVASQATSYDSVEEGLVSADERACTSWILPLDPTVVSN